MTKQEDIIARYSKLKEEAPDLFNARKAVEALEDENASQIRLTLDEAKEFAPFQEGEKVMVPNAVSSGSIFKLQWHDKEGIIKRVVVRLNHKGELEYSYKINAVLVDGTMSSKALISKHDTYHVEQVFKIG
tara:strand:+ start:502 stop:894 length:393 start_codon:yes stop_codon:yes gene_type:complete